MTALQTPDSPVPSRSSFVTVVAWIFIVLSSFSTFIAALQNVMVRSMPLNRVNAALQDSTVAGQLPAAARVMFAHFPQIVIAFFLVSFATLVSSVGLLRRRNWARLAFIGVLGIGVAYMIGGVFLQQSMFSSFDATFRSAAPQDSLFRQNAQQFASMFAVMRVIMAIFSLAMAALFAWIIVRLSSVSVRAEFAPSHRAA